MFDLFIFISYKTVDRVVMAISGTSISEGSEG